MEKPSEFGKCDFCISDEGIMSYASPGVPDCRMCKSCETNGAPVKKKKKFVWTEAKMRSLLLTNNHAVQSALVALYQRQTADEQASHDTKHTNGVGFSGAHAKQGTYLAKWVLSNKNLSGKFIVDGRKIVLHYLRQLVEEGNK